MQADDTLTLSHLELKQGKGNQGGAISVQFNGRLRSTFVLFKLCIADSGGALFVAGSASAWIMGCRFEGNTCKTAGNDVYISSNNAEITLVNNEYSSHSSASSSASTKKRADVSGLVDESVTLCDASIGSVTSTTCSVVNSNLLSSADCTNRYPTAEGIRCTPRDTPVVHRMFSSSCDGVHASLSTAHNIQGCPSLSGSMLQVVGTGFGDTKGTVVVVVPNQRFDEVATQSPACVVVAGTWKDTSFVCTLPPLIGTFNPILITNQVSKKTNVEGIKTLGRELYGGAEDTVSVDPPTIYSLSVGSNGGARLPTLGGEKLTLVGKNFGAKKATSGISVLFGTNMWLNRSNVTWIDDATVEMFSPPGAGIHSLSVCVAGQCSVPSSTHTGIAYIPPFIEAAVVGLRGGKMVVTGTNFGPNFNAAVSSSSLTKFSRSAEARTMCETPIPCTLVKSPNNTHGDLICEYYEWGKDSTCTGRFLVVTVGGIDSNRYPLCWGGAQYTGSLTFAKTPCNAFPTSSFSSDNVLLGTSSHTLKEGQTFSDIVTLSVEPREETGKVYVSVDSSTDLCTVRLPNGATFLTFDHKSSITGFEFFVDVAEDDVVSSGKSYAGFGCTVLFTIDSDDEYVNFIK